jgi:hypothetical protein
MKTKIYDHNRNCAPRPLGLRTWYFLGIWDFGAWSFSFPLARGKPNPGPVTHGNLQEPLATFSDR